MVAEESGPQRSLAILAPVLFVIEAALYSAIGPALPHYVDEFHLSKSSSGVLVGCYPAGLFVGSLMVPLLVSKVGVKRSTIAGLGVLSCATVGFGHGHTIAVLIMFRLLQGFGAGMMWAAALTWSMAAVPASRHGEFIGSMVAIGIVGTLLGPLIGILAIAVTPALLFSGVGLAVAALIVGFAMVPPPPAHRGEAPRGSFARILRSSATRFSAWIVVLVGTSIGMLLVLLPLRLEGLGVGSTGVGGVFMLAAALEAVGAVLLGRATDRRSVGPLIRTGLMGGFVAMIGLAAVDTRGSTLALSVIALAAWPLVALPAIADLNKKSAERGHPRVVVMSFVVVSWALGELVGGPLGSAVAQATSDTTAFVALAVLALVSAAASLAARSGSWALSRGR